MEEKFKYLDHMTDLIVEAYGHSIQELLENSALGLINAMFDTSKIELNHTIQICAQGHDFKSLLYDWLEKIILSIYIDKMIVAKCNSFSFSKIIMTNNNSSTINNDETHTTNDKKIELVVNDLELYEDAIRTNPTEEQWRYKIECVGKGDIIDLRKHEYKVELKSITYHEMEIKRTATGYYSARFLVDL